MGAPKSLQMVTAAMKRCLLLGRKVMTNLDSILKSRAITLTTKVHLVKGMVLPEKSTEPSDPNRPHREGWGMI